MIRVGIIGCGYGGGLHSKIFRKLDNVKIVGCYDTNLPKAETFSLKEGVEFYDSMDALLDAIDVVDIASIDKDYYPIAVTALKKSKHLFIRAFISDNFFEASELIKLTAEARVVTQVGQTNLFANALIKAKEFLNEPRLINIYHYYGLNKQKENSCCLENIIHDVDVIQNLVHSDVRSIHATGIPVFEDTSEIMQIQLEFGNGCLVTLFMNLVSELHKFTIDCFQSDCSVYTDMLNSTINITKYIKDKTSKKEIINLKKEDELCRLKKELLLFLNAINSNQKSLKTIENAYSSLEIAQKIIKKINLSYK